MKKIILFYLFSLLNLSNIIAQSSIIKGGLGYTYNIGKKANGSSVGLEYEQKLKGKHFLSMGIKNIFTQRRGSLPDKLISQKHILKDYTNPVPYKNFFVWTKETFPYYRLPSTPDKYFDFNFSLSYLYKYLDNERYSVKMGLGTCATYHDESEIVEWLQGDFDPGFGDKLTNAMFPVFQYDTYIDVGIIPQFEFQKKLKHNIIVGLSSKLYYFPKSNNSLLNLEGFISVGF